MGAQRSTLRQKSLNKGWYIFIVANTSKDTSGYLTLFCLAYICYVSNGNKQMVVLHPSHLLSLLCLPSPLCLQFISIAWVRVFAPCFASLVAAACVALLSISNGKPKFIDLIKVSFGQSAPKSSLMSMPIKPSLAEIISSPISNYS